MFLKKQKKLFYFQKTFKIKIEKKVAELKKVQIFFELKKFSIFN